jgi:NAD(P)-dependent dehydrogenase (short-subunit alcohol dehydrogenase family)
VNGGVTGIVNTLWSSWRRFVSTASIRASSATVRTGRERTPRSRTRARTPLGRLVTMDEVVDASIFLLENTGVNGANLNVDGG